jgi:LL-diaminopimelate aminotransferase
MIRINEHYGKLQSSYLFSTISKKVKEYQEQHPDREIIKMGIGDVTQGLPRACVQAFRSAVDEMASDDTFRGYGPEQGYGFLRSKIAENDYASRGCGISADEVFVSDGAKCDTANIQELFAADTVVAVPDPVYPVYVDTNVMAGRTGAFAGGRYEGLVYLESTMDNGYLPDLPKEKADLIYLCFPNNPTGTHCTREYLASWVHYAAENKAFILYDAAYTAFIRDNSLPRSIFEVDGAEEVAVEFRSFSKTAGFTGTRCAYTVVPEKARVYDAAGKQHPLHPLWNRRQSTKFNGVSYPVQRAAEAVYSAAGREQVRQLADYYLENARLVREKFMGLGFSCTGGVNSPYIWIYTGKDSWTFFDDLLEKAGVVCTPGDGFGKCGEGHIRISAFNGREHVTTALEKIEHALS